MQITGVKNLNFNGRTKFLSCDSEGNHKKIAECLYGSRYFGDTRGMSDFIQKHSYPYADVEETIGKHHNDTTYKVYIADPNEVVAKSIKRSHDYIVYDNEPEFPDIRKKYYSPNYGNLDKEFQYICDYFNRMENSSVKPLEDVNARIKQQLAIDCKKIFDESAELREEKEKLQEKIRIKTEKIKAIIGNVADYKKSLAVKMSTLPRYKNSLLAKERKLSNLENKSIKLKDKVNVSAERLELVNENINSLKECIEVLKIKVKNYESKMNYWENIIENAPKQISEREEEIKTMSKRIFEIDNLISSNFEKLCSFYKANGIKIIKSFK